MSSGARVLLVDDDPAILELVTMRLEDAGHEVIPASSAEQALPLVEQRTPHVIVTDLQMGKMDGLDFFDRVHASNPTIPVIILTAHGSIPEAVRGTSSGVFAFLTKPFEGKELVARVQSALEISGFAGGGGELTDETWRRSILSASPLIDGLLDQMRMLRSQPVTVLIRGPSGTGKELFARALHDSSDRSSGPYVAVNCSAIPEQLLESELFGHVKGAFSGAQKDHTGLFRAAHRGTLFLDEIGDMPTSLQTKLLRVLEDRVVRPVGSTQAHDVEVRIISATHQDLDAAVAEGRFREDLYYRLNVVQLEIPSLDARREDIPLLAKHFLGGFGERHGKTVSGFAPDALSLLLRAPWPGNVRQLRNVVEQCVALTTTPLISATLTQRALRTEPSETLGFTEARDRFERDYLMRLLRLTDGNVPEAARIAERNRTDFYRLLKKHEIRPAAVRDESDAED